MSRFCTTGDLFDKIAVLQAAKMHLQRAQQDENTGVESKVICLDCGRIEPAGTIRCLCDDDE